jgi:capsular polysaccharide biosynthesis protein
VVKLETDNTNLRREVNEQRERVQSLADSVFRATIDANQKLAEQGGRLSIVDPAFKPVRPSGPGKTIFLMAGMILFLTLGLSFAVGLALIDDRLYRRADLDQLGITVLGVIPPAHLRVKRKPASKAKAKAKAKQQRAPTFKQGDRP